MSPKGTLYLNGKQAKKLMGSCKCGDEVELSIKGRVTSMESRDSMSEIMSSDSPKSKKKSGPEYHVSIEVEDSE